MAVGLDQDSEYLRRTGIASGGAGTMSDGGFANTAQGIWLFRPSGTTTYALTAAGSIIHCQAGAREVVLGFNSAGAALSDLNLQIIFNSGGGAGTPASFSGHAGNTFLDEWVYYFIYESGGTQHAGYIRLAAPTTVVKLSRANDNAGSQYVNTLTFGNESGGGAVAMGHYAYGRARYASGLTDADMIAWAAATAPLAGDWAAWALPNNSTLTDGTGNGRTLTGSGGLTSETSPTLGGGAAALEAAAAAVASVTGALTTAIRFAAAPQAVASVSAGLTTAIRAAASMSAVAVMTATLSTAIRPAAAMAATATATGNLSTSIRLAATPSATATQTGNLSTQIRFAAAPAAVAAISANLTTAVRMQAQAAAVATMTAALDGAVAALQASPAAVASLTANLSTAIRPAAALVAQATMTASLAGTAADLQAAMAGQAQLAGALTTAIPLAAAPQAVASGSGALTTSIRMQVVMAGVVTMTASLDAVPIYTSSPGFVVSRQKARPYTVTRIRARQFTVRTR